MSEYFDLDKPIWRMSYFKRWLSAWLLIYLIVFLAWFLVMSWKINANIAYILWWILILPLLYFSICNSIKRARDLGGTWYFVASTLVVLTILSIVNLLRPDLVLTTSYYLYFFNLVSWINFIQSIYLLFFPWK